jgi:LuxR family maltose regulon positive regulatory protein
MATGIPVSKITRPSIRDILPRKRLFGELDAARDRPIIYVTGPPGSGKTTLVASYLDFKKMPCLWYQVD